LIALFIFFSFFSFGCLSSSLVVDYSPDKIHQAPTVDGLHVGLVHLPPEGKARQADPIIMCHGFTSTAISYDMGNGGGMGPYLAKGGYDVWILNLRGRKYSSVPNSGKGHLDYDWTFDDYLNYDLPAAIKYVTDYTGAKKVTWIGHSMGGMLIYAYLGSPKTSWRNDVGKIVTMASPVNFSPVDDTTKMLASLGKVIVGKKEMLPVHPMAMFFGKYMAKNRDLGEWTINPHNFSEKTTRMYLANGTPNISGSAIHQFLGWLKTNEFKSLDGLIDYRAGISRIKVSALILTGKLDNIAPTWAVYPGYEFLGSPDKTFVLVGQVSGCKEDHGHGGCIMGNWAEDEVFPIIKSWLDKRTK